jgi:hypothetical protein
MAGEEVRTKKESKKKIKCGITEYVSLRWVYYNQKL